MRRKIIVHYLKVHMEHQMFHVEHLGSSLGINEVGLCKRNEKREARVQFLC